MRLRVYEAPAIWKSAPVGGCRGCYGDRVGGVAAVRFSSPTRRISLRPRECAGKGQIQVPHRCRERGASRLDVGAGERGHGSGWLDGIMVIVSRGAVPA